MTSLQSSSSLNSRFKNWELFELQARQKYKGNLYSELPLKFYKDYNIPIKDYGIDVLLTKYDDELKRYIVNKTIQCKYSESGKYNITFDKLANFNCLSNIIQKKQNEYISKMLNYFNDETNKGKLFINYPMIESIRYFK